MNLKNYLICFIATGIIFGCGEQIDTGENSSSLIVVDLSHEISDFQQYQIQTQSEFDSVLLISGNINKPVLIHITGYTSVSSRMFEDRIWPDPLVYPILKNQFIIASLYVDDRTPLISSVLEDTFNTVGQRWMNYEIDRYNMETQPIFDIVNSSNESLVKEVSNYRSHGEAILFKAWLEEGLSNFRKSN